MHRRVCRLSLVVVVAMAVSSSASAVNWVPIQEPGNACDPHPAGCFGKVLYSYEISEHEVTNLEYIAFLNAVADTDTNNLFHPNMSSGTGGIVRGGSSGSYAYAPISGRGDMPVNWVTWYDALRYANWLHNGQPGGAQTASTTEDGAYTLSGPTTAGPRNACATNAIPTENEWFKAAYYSSSAVYFDYPTGSDTPTTCNFPDSADTANCNNVVGDLTIVGSYASSPSPYGTSDQGGNVWEWNETIPTPGPPGTRRLHGGAFDSNAATLASGSVDQTFVDTVEYENVGFRVVRLRTLSTGPDADADCIPDVLDKCIFDSRNAPSTCDDDVDGYGNVCDADFNQSFTVTATDYSMYFLPGYVPPGGDPNKRGYDMNCNGVIEGYSGSPNGIDFDEYFLPRFKSGQPPGPSGLSCAGTPGCS